MLKNARTVHREWCLMAFELFLPSESSDRYETILSAYIAGTEFYLWKLMRRDLGKSLKECRQIFLFTLESLAAKSTNQ